MIRLAALLTLIASPALALECGPREVIARNLAEKYGEALVSGGLAANAIFEVWASLETGTWTILRTAPEGTSCLMASGTDWQSVVAIKGDPA